MVLQKEIDAIPKDGTLQLAPGDLPGPIVINRPLTLEGKGTTIWALKGPVVSIRSNHVTLRNLMIEVTSEGWNGSATEACAIAAGSFQSLVLENVKISGAITGLPEEDGPWRYPYSVQMGKLPYGSEHDFILRLIVPVPCRLTSNIYGMNVEPRSLAPGKNEIHLRLERMSADTLLHGVLALSSAFLTRQILVSGHTVSPAEVKGLAKNQILWQPQDWATVSFAPKPPEPAAPPPPLQPVAPPAASPTPSVAKPPLPLPLTSPAKPTIMSVAPLTNPPAAAKPVAPATPIVPPPMPSSPPSASSFRRPGKPMSTLFKDNKPPAPAEAMLNSNDRAEKKNANAEEVKPPVPPPPEPSTKTPLPQPKKTAPAPNFQHVASIPLSPVFTPKSAENNPADQTATPPPEKPLPVNQPVKKTAPAKPKPGNPNNIASIFKDSNKTIKKA